MSDPIRSTGRRGFGFEQKGFQERNLQLLLETLSKKETQKAIESLAKIEKDEWKAMAETASFLNTFISLGGKVALFNTMQESIKETIKLQIDSLLSPLTNEINQAITDQLAPFINDLLTPLINDLTTFLSENRTGAGIGGIVGSIASLFLPGGPFLVAIGAIIGAAIENLLSFFTQGTLTEDMVVLQRIWWEETGGGGTLSDFVAWLQARGSVPSNLPISGEYGGPGGVQEDF